MASVDINFQKELSWDYEECTLRTFRVQGKCQTPNEECPLPCSSSDKQQFVVNVTACSVEDVCKKLKDSDFVRPILSVEVYNKPLISGDGVVFPTSLLFDENLDPTCFIDVTPTPNSCFECCDFLLDETPIDIVGAFGVVGYHFTGSFSGGMTISSGFVSAIHLSFPASGNMTISGSTHSGSSGYGYRMQGQMTINGRSSVQSSRYVYTGSGTMVISGGTEVTSSGYQHTMSGSMTISSSSNLSMDFSRSGSGTMTISGGFGVGGHDYHYSFVPSGIMIINGSTHVACSRYLCGMSGSMTINGATTNSLHYYAGTGTMRITGRTKLRFGYVMNGSMGISGISVPTWGTSYDGSGTMRMSSGFRAISSAFYYGGSGIMSMSSSTFAQNSDLGELGEFVGAIDSLENINSVFDTISAPSIVPTIKDVILPSCCSSVIPSLLELRYNLASIQSLNRFLLRNGYTLLGDLSVGNFIPLRYNQRAGVWQANLHLEGLSVINSGDASWDFSFEFGCTDQVSGSYLGANVWKFSFFIKNKEFLTNQTFVMRLLNVWELSVVCPPTKQFDGFDFDFNLQKRTSVPVNVSPPVFHDEANMFGSSPVFRENPVIKIRISIGDKARLQTFDHSLDTQRNAASAIADGFTI